MKDSITTFYSKRTWLNPEDSYSTGSVCCFDGEIVYPNDKEKYRQMYFKLADCHQIVNIHNGSYDTPQDFIDKMKLLRSELDEFISYLESEKCPK